MNDDWTKLDVGSGWQTPLSDGPNLQFVSLKDDEALILIVNKTSQYPQFISYQITWPSYCAYRNQWEELGPAWSVWDQSSPTTGCTNIVLNSGWIACMRERSPYFMETLWPKVKHFVISTGDFITEILSEDEPSIIQIENVEPSWSKNPSE